LPSGVELGSQSTGYGFSAEVPHLFAYRREPGRAVYWLDERCHQDYAKTLLPEIGRAVVAAFDLLFRGKLEVAESDGRLEVRPAEVPLGKGRVTLFSDGADGRRQALGSAYLSGGEPVLLSVPSNGQKRLAALFRGVDAAGEPIVVARELTLP
jgi:hypothetical protein